MELCAQLTLPGVAVWSQERAEEAMGSKTRWIFGDQLRVCKATGPVLALSSLSSRPFVAFSPLPLFIDFLAGFESSYRERVVEGIGDGGRDVYIGVSMRADNVAIVSSSLVPRASSCSSSPAMRGLVLGASMFMLLELLETKRLVGRMHRVY